MEYLEASRTLYVQDNVVADDGGDTMAKFSAEIVRFAETHPVDRLVLDVRSNTGGNNYLNAALVRAVLHARLDTRGKLFVVIGRLTFSAAQNLVNDLKKYAEPIFVGEPTGARPNEYGDPVPIELPNSRLVVMASTFLYSDGGRGNDRPWTPPDLPAELSFAQYRSNFDPAVDAALRYRSVTAALLASIDSGDIASVERAFHAFRGDSATGWIPTEREMNGLGYALLGDGRAAIAEAIFRLNAEDHPESANALDSLGEAYLGEGKLALARQSYERALALSPGSENARRMLDVIARRQAGRKEPSR